MERNHFARFFVMASALAIFTGIAAAQSKIAVISMQQAILDTAEVKKAATELEAKYKPRQAELDKLRKDLEEIQTKLQGGKVTPQEQSDLTQQGQRKQRDLQRMSQDLQEEVDNVRNEVLQSSGRKMQEVVRKLADERGVDMIVEASSTLFVKPTLDLTKDAVAAFDKAYPPK